MDLSEYGRTAIRTMSDTTPHSENILGCALGLLGEAIEWRGATSKQKRIEEAGDLMWYVAATAHLHSIHLGSLELPEIALRDTIAHDNVLRFAGLVGERVKKETFHGHLHEPETMRTHLAALIANLARWCECFGGTTLEEVMAANIAKLKRRYPNGFSTADSIARVDVASPVGGGGSGAG
jgi:NTP pyrophosphatase (non-canonical NTP hydrolase)